jgi:hypothetical protein
MSPSKAAAMGEAARRAAGKAAVMSNTQPKTQRQEGVAAANRGDPLSPVGKGEPGSLAMTLSSRDCNHHYVDWRYIVCLYIIESREKSQVGVDQRVCFILLQRGVRFP